MIVYNSLIEIEPVNNIFVFLTVIMHNCGFARSTVLTIACVPESSKLNPSHNRFVLVNKKITCC